MFDVLGYGCTHLLALIYISVYEMPRTILKNTISTAWIFLCSFSVRVHASNAYKKIHRTNASCSLDDKLMFLSLYMGLIFVSAALICGVLARTWVFEPLH